jgi:hypothetical protein
LIATVLVRWSVGGCIGELRSGERFLAAEGLASIRTSTLKFGMANKEPFSFLATNGSKYDFQLYIFLVFMDNTIVIILFQSTNRQRPQNS